MSQRNETFGRHVIGCGIAFLLWVSAVPHARGDTIALVKSYDFGPYDAALSGFVSACDKAIVEYNLRGETSGNADLVSEIRSQEPQLIVAIGILAAEFAKREFEDVTVLYVMVPNPSAYGLTGENIAGISLDIPIERQLEVYRAMVSDMRALGAIYDPRKSAAFVAEAKAVAERIGLTLHTREVASRKEVPSALRALLREEEIDALWMIPDDTVVTPESFKFLLLTSFEHNLPFLAASDIFVKVGALASLTPDYADVGRQGCELATALTSGRTSSARINVVVPAKINLSINLKTARKIGLAIPEEVIATADVVYR
jgi:putative ABC transport system substrate-binding protein